MTQKEVLFGFQSTRFAYSLLRPTHHDVCRQERHGALLVIAVAGSNKGSWYDWIVEDSLVGRTVPWPYAEATQRGLDPRIARGTALALEHLLQDIQADGWKIGEHLENVLAEGEPLEIMTAGHSLGGALAPALAMALVDTQASWDAGGLATVSTCSFAGPAFGNADFAAHADAAIGARAHRIWNTLDVAPYIWDQSFAGHVTDIYYPEISPGFLERSLPGIARAISHGKDYTHIRADAPGLQGRLKVDAPADVDRDRGDAAQTEPHPFLQQAHHQHAGAYYDLLGAGELKTILVRKPPEHVSRQESDGLGSRLKKLGEKHKL